MNCREAQDDVWGDNPEALIASGLSVSGATAQPVDDGILLDGVWSFSSGVDFADWLHLQVFVPQEDGPPEPRFALVPRGLVRNCRRLERDRAARDRQQVGAAERSVRAELPERGRGRASPAARVSARDINSRAALPDLHMVGRNPDLLRPRGRYRARRAGLCRERVQGQDGRGRGQARRTADRAGPRRPKPMRRSTRRRRS